MGVNKFLKKAKEIEEKHQQRRHKDDDKGHDGGGHDESNWLVSYADMMTLLCGFFVMLFSMAKMDEPKYEQVKEALSKQFQGEYKAPPSYELAQSITQVIQEAGIEKQTSIKYDAVSVNIAFQSTLFFDTLSADVKPQGREVLSKLINALGQLQVRDLKQFRVVVEGHTDARPILGGNFPSNWELAGARSSRVVRHFMEQGFSPKHLTAISYGDTRPSLPSRFPSGAWDEDALAKNRRVVIRILDPKVDAIPFPDDPSAAPTTESTAIVVPPDASIVGVDTNTGGAAGERIPAAQADAQAHSGAATGAPPPPPVEAVSPSGPAGMEAVQ